MSETELSKAGRRFDERRQQKKARRDNVLGWVFGPQARSEFEPSLELDEYEAQRARDLAPSFKAIERNPILGALSDVSTGAANLLNKVEVGFKPTNSFIGLGELSPFAGAGELLDDAAHGFSPVEGGGQNTRLDPRVADLADITPFGTAKSLAGRGIAAATGLATTKLPKRLSLTPRETGVVSTRLPTGKTATEDALGENLIVDLDSAKANPESFEKNVSLLADYPNVRPGASGVDESAEEFIQHAEDNLIWLFDQMPPDVRDRAMKWYDGANKISHELSGTYGVSPEQSAGMIAVLSPQKDWFQNVSLAERTIDVLSNKGTASFTPEMMSAFDSRPALQKYRSIIESMSGKSLDDLTDAEAALFVRMHDEAFSPRSFDVITPEGGRIGKQVTQSGDERKVAWGSLGEIGKAVRIYRDGSIESISKNLGDQHKVRNFYNNIFDPENPEHVTIDTHAVAAGLLRPLSGSSPEVSHALGGTGSSKNAVNGVTGTYPLYAEAYRRAADRAGVLPRQMQSVTWEGVRGLYTDVQKRNKPLLANISRIWENYRLGHLSLEEAREQSAILAGGINPPEWVGK